MVDWVTVVPVGVSAVAQAHLLLAEHQALAHQAVALQVVDLVTVVLVEIPAVAQAHLLAAEHQAAEQALLADHHQAPPLKLELLVRGNKDRELVAPDSRLAVPETMISKLPAAAAMLS